MVVCSGFPWWFCGGLWWFIVVFLQKSPEKGHVTLYLTNHRTKVDCQSPRSLSNGSIHVT